jgi:hypothetical protein
MAITCDSCGLKNPNSAVMCDCGLVLRSDVDRRILAGARNANYEVQSRNLAKPIGIGVGVTIVILLLKVILSMSR